MSTLRRRAISPLGLIVVAIVFLALLVSALWFRRQVQIDRCLDAGGRWDGRECEGASLL